MSRDAAEDLPKAGVAACAVAAIYSDFISRVRCDSSAGALTEEAFAREVQFHIDAAVKAGRAEGRASLRNSYPHMCRDGHEEIGWRGEGELCPVCVARDEGRTEAFRLASRWDDLAYGGKSPDARNTGQVIVLCSDHSLTVDRCEMGETRDKTTVPACFVCSLRQMVRRAEGMNGLLYMETLEAKAKP